MPGHIVAFTNASNDVVERLPDPEWDRMAELERRLNEIERRLGVQATGGGFDGGSARDAAEETRS